MIRRGYTIIEILIVLAILGLLFGVGYVNYRDYARRQTVTAAMRSLRSDLKLAAEQAIAGKKPSGCTGNMDGVKFTVTSTSTYEISASCTSGDVTLRQGSLPTGITMNIPSVNPILFKVIGNGTNIPAGSSVVVGLTQNFTDNYRSVVISPSGDIKESSETPAPATASPSPTPSGPPSGTNLAQGKGTTQSSTYSATGVPTGSSSKAVDGNTNGNYSSGSVTHTNSQAGAWWQVDLGANYDIGNIQIWNRTDCCANRLTNFDVIVSNSPGGSGQSMHVAGTAGRPTTLTANTNGRYVRVRLVGTNYLSLAEVIVLSR